MKLIKTYISRNWLSWNEGTHTLDIRYRGSKDELMQKVKEEIEKDLFKDA